MPGINIIGTGKYVPDFVLTNDDMAKFIDTSDEWIRTRTGMERRHISLGEPVWYMGARAAKVAIDDAGVSPEDIDMIVVTTATPDGPFPSTGCLIQKDIGAVNAFAFDISVACAGVTYSLDIARRYLATGGAKTVLVVGTENLTQFLDYNDRATCVLFGDGAGAFVVQGGDGIFGTYLHTDPSGADHIYYRRTRRALPPQLVPSDAPLDLYLSDIQEAIYMNGREVYKFGTRAMPETLGKACESVGMVPSDLDVIIPHQANLRIIETAAKSMGISMDKFYVNIHEYSNTSSASIMICLDEGIRTGRIKRGDKVGLVGFGAGLTLGACVFIF